MQPERHRHEPPKKPDANLHSKDAVKKSAAMRFDIFAMDLGKGAQVFLCLLGQLSRNFHRNFHHQVTAAAAVLAQFWESTVIDYHSLARLNPRWNLNDGRLALKAIDVDFGPKNGLGNSNFNWEKQIKFFALEFFVLLDLDENIKIAHGAAVCSGFAFARNAQAHSRIDARRNLDFDVACLGLVAAARTIGTNFGNTRALAAAVRAG